MSQFSNSEKDFTIFEMSKQHRRRRDSNVKLFDFKQDYMNAQKRFAIESQNQTLFDDVFRVEKSVDVINDSNSKKQFRTKSRRTERNFITSNSIFQSQQITSSATKKKERSKKSNREKKSTILESIQEIIDDELQTFIKIVDISVKSHIELWVKNLNEFVVNVTKKSKNWWNNIQSVIVDRKTTNIMIRDQINTIQRQQVFFQTRNDQLKNMREKLTKTKNKLAFVISSVKNITHLKHEITRIKNLRNAHKKKESKLFEQIHQLRLNKINLKKKIAKFQKQQKRQRRSRYEMNEKSNDDDDKQSFVKKKRSKNRFAARLSSSKQKNYMSDVFELNNFFINNYTNSMNNQSRKKTYFKLNEFYDAHENWKKWKNHFKTKVEIDDFMFLNEQHKIRYVRKHTRKTVYDIVKHRVVANSENSYQTLKELILNLKQVFEKKNKMFKAIDELFSSNFRMNSNKKNETFDEFLIRFNNLAVLVKLQTKIKIKYFRDKLTKKMKFKMFHLKICINWNDFVKSCKNVYDDNANLNNYKNAKFIKNDAIKMSFNKISRSKRKHRSRSKFNEKFSNRKNRFKRFINKVELMNRFSEHIVKKFKKKERCFKCLKIKHLTTNSKTFCKHEKNATKEKALIEFAAIKVKWNDVDVKDYESKFFDFDTSSSHSKN